jgi:hypothetical protein
MDDFHSGIQQANGLQFGGVTPASEATRQGPILGARQQIERKYSPVRTG